MPKHSLFSKVSLLDCQRTNPSANLFFVL